MFYQIHYFASGRGEVSDVCSFSLFAVPNTVHILREKASAMRIPFSFGTYCPELKKTVLLIALFDSLNIADTGVRGGLRSLTLRTTDFLALTNHGAQPSNALMGVVACATRLSTKDKLSIEWLVALQGGTYTDKMDVNVTHLISPLVTK
jgi:hypothetical protein